MNGLKHALMLCMDKTEAIQLLGGTAAEAARAIGITVQAVAAWPDPLPQRIADRVQAALWRRANPGKEPTNSEPEEQESAVKAV